MENESGKGGRSKHLFEHGMGASPILLAPLTEGKARKRAS
jgi:hypothetical protein